MRINKMWFFLPVAIFFLTSGCVPLVVGGAAVGGGTGTYYYVNGEMQADYPQSLDKVWAACEKTLADMRALDVRPYKGIGKGTIKSVIKEKKVEFIITYRSKNVTNVAIRVGMFGDETASQLLHDSIAENLSRATPS